MNLNSANVLSGFIILSQVFKPDLIICGQGIVAMQQEPEHNDTPLPTGIAYVQEPKENKNGGYINSTVCNNVAERYRGLIKDRKKVKSLFTQLFGRTIKLEI